MKELQPHTPLHPAYKIVKPIIKQQHIDTLRPYPGQKCFELNLATGEIKPAAYQTTTVELGKEAVTHKVVMKDNCRYVVAINIENAQKKFFRAIRQR